MSETNDVNDAIKHFPRLRARTLRFGCGAPRSAQTVGDGSRALFLRSDGPEDLAWSLVVDSMIFAAEAEVRWLDHTEQRLALHPDHAMTLALSTDRPKRGRPAKEPLSSEGAGL